MSRLNWLQEVHHDLMKEQLHLMQLYQIQGITSWKQISRLLYKKFHNCYRSAKQCRERYRNFIRFRQRNERKGAWTKEEHKHLFEKYMQLGSKWVIFSEDLAGRSENDIKNRFYGTVRKLLRRVNLLLKQNKTLHKIRKPIKEKSVFKLLQTQFPDQGRELLEVVPQQSKQEFVIKLKSSLLEAAQKIDDEAEDELLFELGCKIHKFNTLTRFQFTKKCKKSTLSKEQIKKSTKQNPNDKFFKISEYIADEEKKDERQPIEHTMQTKNDECHLLTFDNVESWKDCNIASNSSSAKADLEYELSLILGTEYHTKLFGLF